MTTALIDGDILVYRTAFSCEDKTEMEALVQLDTYIEEILFNSGAGEYKIYLTDGAGNFRKKIYPAYKANRKQPKPKHYEALRNHLIKVELAEVAWGQEADDALGIAQSQAEPDTTIICSIDKDLMMIPGWHYNFVKDEHIEVNELEGLRNFYRQLLTGDTTDNIPGIHGIGPKTANDLLAGCEFEEDYYPVILRAYMDYFPHCSRQEVENHINIIGRLLYIRRKEGEEWSFAVD